MASSLGLEAQMQQLQEMTAQAEALQGEVDVAWAASALIWRVVAAIIVFIMQVGFSLIEAGTVRYKNTRNIMIKNALDTCVSNIAFWIFGYAFAFGEGSKFIGWKFPDGQVAFAQVQDPVFFFYQFVFVATSATIFAGAVAERTQISAYLLFNFFLAALIYPVVAHMLWAPSGLMSVESRTQFLGSVGVLDNAGSMVVHVTGGVTSLVAAWAVGPRLGRFDINGRPVRFRGHSMVFIAAGTLAIWVGFLGFNGGSVVLYKGEDPWTFVRRVHGSIMNTVISGALAGATCFMATYWRREPCPEHTFNGVLGGLVAACATSSLVYPYAAAVIGITSGLVYLTAVWVITDKGGIDDPVHASAVHLGCGVWGAISAGLWANPEYVQDTYNLTQVSSCGLFYGCGFTQLAVQVVALLLVLAWVGTTSLVLFLTLNFFGLLRVNRQEEEVGLDIAFHGAGVTADDALDVAHMEEGGLEGPKLVALRARLATWRRMRALAQHRRPDPPPPSYSASRNTSLGSHHSANSATSHASKSSKGSPKSQGSGPRTLSAFSQGLGLGALAGSATSGVPQADGEITGTGAGVGVGRGGGAGTGASSHGSGSSTLALNGAVAEAGGARDSLWRSLVSSLESSLSALAGFGARATGAVRQGLGGNARDVWHKDLESTSLGQFSLAMYEANYVMEDALEAKYVMDDALEVNTAPEWVFMAVHDGHNGSEAAEFVRDSLWGNIKARCRAAGLPAGVASNAGISAGFLDTEVQFTEVVREAFDDSAPHLATVGACTAAVLVTRRGLWAANVGDCRAVLGQVRVEGAEMEIRAVQMTQEHNLADAGVREAYRLQHLDMADAVQYKRGSHRVKGRVTVTRCFGDLYLKSHEFNREPLVSRFRIPEPFNPPLLSAQPAVASRTLSPHDSFVVLASDGLFEFLTNEDVVRIVAMNPRKDIARTLVRSAVEKAALAREVPLAELLRKPSGDRRSFHDDISVIVFFFDHDALQAPKPRLWHQSTSYRGGSSTKAASDAFGAGLDFSLLSSVQQALGPKEA